MNKNVFGRSIHDAFIGMLELNLTSWDRFPNKSSLSISERFRQVALDPTMSYEHVYRVGLEERHYNFILTDYSYFQFSLITTAPNVAMRCAYVPNPYAMPDDETLALLDGVSSYEALELWNQMMDEAEPVLRRPPIRFDLAPSSHKVLRHPAGHLHIGWNVSNRWPMKKIATPRLFSLLVAKHYYEDEWSALDEEVSNERGFWNKHDDALASEKSSCGDTPKFDPIEERHPFIW